MHPIEDDLILDNDCEGFPLLVPPWAGPPLSDLPAAYVVADRTFWALGPDAPCASAVLRESKGTKA